MNPRITLAALAISAAGLLASPALSSPVTKFCGERPCPTIGPERASAASPEGRRSAGAPRRAYDANANRQANGRARPGDGYTVLGGRPAACAEKPHRTAGLWCGCASAIDVGLSNADGFWDLAAHWGLYMERAQPAPGMAHVTSGHVNVLRSHVADSIWLVYDPNNHNRALLREIDIRHGKIVDPKTARIGGYASLSAKRHKPAKHHRVRYAGRRA